MDSSAPLRLVNPSGHHQPVVQVLPFSVNAVGFGLLPLQLPLKPICVDCPGARDPFQDRFVAVTCVPDCVQFADQPWAMLCEPGQVNFSDQLRSAEVPVLAMVTDAVKPPGHWLETA